MKQPSKYIVIALFASALGLTALSLSGQATKQESAASLTVRRVRLFDYFPSNTKPRTFRLKSHGQTIAEITIANLKGIPMEIAGGKAVLVREDNAGEMRTMSVRDGAKVELCVQDGEPIRITADEIEWDQPVSPGLRK
jgi:hypothetical protein